MMQTYYDNAIFTNHAIQRLQERGITQSDAWYAFQHPDGQVRGNTIGSTKFFKNYGNQRIEVVAKLNEKKEWVILSCWSRVMGTGKSIFPRKKENPIWSYIKYFFSTLIGK